MIKCEKARWRMDLRTQPVPDPPRGGVVILNITNDVTGADISGDVLNETGGKISTFTGTCRPAELPDFNIMTFDFVWGAANIFLSGSARAKLGDVNRFTGGFRATARTDRLSETDAVAFNTDPPDPGDTGTGNGSQT